MIRKLIKLLWGKKNIPHEKSPESARLKLRVSIIPKGFDEHNRWDRYLACENQEFIDETDNIQ